MKILCFFVGIFLFSKNFIFKLFIFSRWYFMKFLLFCLFIIDFIFKIFMDEDDFIGLIFDVFVILLVGFFLVFVVMEIIGF